MSQRIERNGHSPEERISALEQKFNTATRTIIGVLRERPGSDFTIVAASKEETALGLDPSGMWGMVGRDGILKTIGPAESVSAKTILYIYASMKDDGLFEEVRTATASLNGQANDANSDEYRMVVEPVIRGYVAQHRERLMEELVRDTATSLGRLTEIPGLASL